MTVIVFGIPQDPVEPAPLVTSFPGFTLTLTGSDGSVWDLTTPAGLTGGVEALAGAEGLDRGVWELPTTETVASPGSSWGPVWVSDREIRLPVRVADNSSQTGFMRVWDAWQRATVPGTVCVLAVTNIISGTTREIEMTLVDDGSTWAKLPTVGRRHVWPTRWRARPFFLGGTVARTFAAVVNPQDFLPQVGREYWFLMPSRTQGEQTMRNPGEYEAFPVITLTGPSTYAKVVIDGETVEFPFTVGANDAPVVLDTDPAGFQQAMQGGANRTADLGLMRFAPIARGDDVPIEVVIEGEGSVVVALRPPHFQGLAS